MNKLAIIGALMLLSGCASAPPEWLKTDSCRSIGCGKDLTFYPNERGGASRQARDWHGFEWGKTSSACRQNDPNVKPCVKKKLSKSKLRGIGTTDKSFQQSKIIAPFKPKSNQNLVNLW